MTTAREQAREAARKKNGGMRDMLGLTVRATDAASDVWEPLLRELVEAIETRHEWDAVQRLHDAIDRAKEALGD